MMTICHFYTILTKKIKMSVKTPVGIANEEVVEEKVV